MFERPVPTRRRPVGAPAVRDPSHRRRLARDVPTTAARSTVAEPWIKDGDRDVLVADRAVRIRRAVDGPIEPGGAPTGVGADRIRRRDPQVDRIGSAARGVVRRLPVTVLGPDGGAVPIDTRDLTRSELHQVLARMEGIRNGVPNDQRTGGNFEQLLRSILLLQKAIAIGDYRDSPLFGLPTNVIERFATICSAASGVAQPTDLAGMEAVEATAERKQVNIFGGTIKSVMKPNEIRGLKALCQSLAAQRSPVAFAYVMLGNSTAPLVACLAAFPELAPGATVIPLPISEIEEDAFEMWDEPTERQRMIVHLAKFIDVGKLQGKTPLVIDISASGKSPRIGAWLLERYFQAIGAPQQVAMQVLNRTDRAHGPLGPIPAQQLGRLAPSSPFVAPVQEAMQQAILEKVLKDEMLFKMWVRTPMVSIFRGDSPPPDLLRGEFQRMMADILKMPHVLAELDNFT